MKNNWKRLPPARRAAYAEIELRKRRAASLVPSIPLDNWLPEVTPQFTWDWPHLRYIREHLNRVTSGEIKRLMVFVPPRHGKTEQGTVRYPVYRLEYQPTLRVILGAYNQTLANKFSRKARRIARERFALSDERSAVEDWETLQGGGIRAVGVGGGITGQGGDLILIDDPVKSREEAESKAFRERVWDWYTDDLYTRLEPGGAIVLTMTRWHDDDLAGRILKSDDAPNWTTITLPALAKNDDPMGRQPGQALCPDRYDEKSLLSIKKIQGISFEALYQQNPVPDEGGNFKRGWLRYWQQEADHVRLEGETSKRFALSDCRRFATVDLAFSLKTTADYTVIASWAVTPESDLVLLDVVRDRMEGPDIIPAMKRAIAKHNLTYVAVESVGAQLTVIQQARRQGLPIRALSADKDKISRSVTATILCESGKLYLPARASWLADYEAELLTFPSGAHDDMVDVTSYAALQVSTHRKLEIIRL